MKAPKKNIKKSSLKKTLPRDTTNVIAGLGGAESVKRFNDDEDEDFDLPIDELDGFDELDSFEDEEDY